MRPLTDLFGASQFAAGLLAGALALLVALPSALGLAALSPQRGRRPGLAGPAFVVAVLLGLAWLLPPGGVRAVVMVLAVFTGLYALFDLRDALWRSSVRASSDAALLAAQTHVPALVWAGLWSLLSVAVLALAAVVSLRRTAPRDSEALETIRSLAASGTTRTTPRP